MPAAFLVRPWVGGLVFFVCPFIVKRTLRTLVLCYCCLCA